MIGLSGDRSAYIEEITRDADAHGDDEYAQVVPADEKERLYYLCLHESAWRHIQ